MQDKLLTEDFVQDQLLKRVMNRLQGKTAEEDQENEMHQLSDQQLKLKEDLARIDCFASELRGIVSSIHALINVFNAKIEEGLSGRDSIITQPPELFNEIFSVDFQRFDQLMQNEIEKR